MHENKCYYLKMDPAVTPMFPQVPAYYYDPTVGTWYQMPDLGTPQVEVTWGYAGMACLPPHAYREDDPELPRPENIYPPGVVKVWNPSLELFGAELLPRCYYLQHVFYLNHNTFTRGKQIKRIVNYSQR